LPPDIFHYGESQIQVLAAIVSDTLKSEITIHE
jgi:hypothetical protein